MGAETDHPHFELPADLTLLTDEAVDALENEAVAEFNRVRAEKVTAETLTYARTLAADIDKIKSANAGRKAAATEAASRAQQAMLEEQARLDARVNGPAEPPADAPPAAAAAAVDADAIAAAAARGTTEALVALMDDKIKRHYGVLQVKDRPRAPLSAAQSLVPPPGGGASTKGAVTASVNIPGMKGGDPLDSLGDVVSAFNRTAKSVRVTADGIGQETQVCTINQSFEHTMDDRTTPAQVDDLLRYLTQPKNQGALVAGGGWCAPSEIRYELFNLACSDGLVDLPTVGISRGGLQIPVSPSLADAVFDVGSTGTANKNLASFGAAFSNVSSPWLWTETDDIATVTGSPNKPVVRVPCPTFGNNRLECYGIILTAGNLTDDAYPEATANTLRLLQSAWSHAQNGRIISQMVALSSAAITISGSGNRPAYNQILSGMDLAATDYRSKFGMCDTDVLELVAPIWLSDVITADLAWRTKVDLLSVTLDQISGYFRDRNIRVQWVQDWQTRGSGQFGNPAALPGGAMVAWPTQCDVMLYAAGTFLKGNGLSLDLGVIRDSVLNAENDFTAAFTEECHLVARVGHESRRYTIGFVVNGSDAGVQPLGAYV
jgi:hypothetical protein